MKRYKLDTGSNDEILVGDSVAEVTQDVLNRYKIDQLPDGWTIEEIEDDTMPAALAEQELRLFAVFCARKVQHMLTDQRLRDAIDTAEKFALGKATSDQLAAAEAMAADAARDAAEARAAASFAAADAARASSAAADAAWAAAQHAAFDAAWAADRNATWSAAWDAAWAAQADWLRANTTPNFGVEVTS